MPVLVSDYTAPTSWTDKGMDWSAPDPLRADYARAVWDAALERGLAPAGFVPPAPGQPLETAKLRALRDSIAAGCGDFCAYASPATGHPYADAPLFTSSSFAQMAGADFFADLDTGATPDVVSAWLAAAKRVLSRMRCRRSEALRSQAQGYELTAASGHPLYARGGSQSERAALYAEVQAAAAYADYHALHLTGNPRYTIYFSEKYINSAVYEVGVGSGVIDDMSVVYSAADDPDVIAGGAPLLALRFARPESSDAVFEDFGFFASGAVAENEWTFFVFDANGECAFDFTPDPPRLPALPAAQAGNYQDIDFGLRIADAQLIVDLDPILKFK